LAPHLTLENQAEVLAEAAGKTTRQIEELVARLAPQPAGPTVIRKVPSHANATVDATPALPLGDAIATASPDSSASLALAPPAPTLARHEERAVIDPLTRSEEHTSELQSR